MQSGLVAFTDSRTLRKPAISGVQLSQEIEEQFGVPVSRTRINALRRSLRFKCQPPRHNQMPTAGQVADRTAFSTKILAMREVLGTIHFSDESRVVLGDDRG
jgi:hypothetical protein